MTTASIESDFGRARDTNTPGKTYRGIFQLGPSEWEEMGGGDRDNRALQIDHGAKLLALRKQQLAQSLGREPTNAEVYLAHQQGVAGATALINNPNMPAGQAVTMAGGRPVNIEGNFRKDPNDPSKNGRYYANAPSSEFVAHWNKNYNDDLAKIRDLPPWTPSPTTTQIASAAPAGRSDMPSTTLPDVETNALAPVPVRDVPGRVPGQVAGQAPQEAPQAAKPPMRDFMAEAAAQDEKMRRVMALSALGGALAGMKPITSGYDPGRVEAAGKPGPVRPIGAVEPTRPMQSPVTGFGQMRVNPLEIRPRAAAGGGQVRAPVFPELYAGLNK
jgi:hypothetical protein